MNARSDACVARPTPKPFRHAHAEAGARAHPASVTEPARHEANDAARRTPRHPSRAGQRAKGRMRARRNHHGELATCEPMAHTSWTPEEKRLGPGCQRRSDSLEEARRHRREARAQRTTQRALLRAEAPRRRVLQHPLYE